MNTTTHESVALPATGAASDYEALYRAAIDTLARVDAALGLPEDGCNTPMATLERIRLLKNSIHGEGTGRPSFAPQVCPITGREFFMVIDHPEHGLVPTYGGPYDSYTIPERDGESFTCERYDHDFGGWVDCYESVGLRLIDDQRDDCEHGEVEKLRLQVRQADERGDEALRRAHTAEAEAEQLRAEVQRLQALANKHELHAARNGHMFQLMVLPMQAAAIEAEETNATEAMRWITNTLIFPGLYPDLENAKAAGGAQAWFDREKSAEEARYDAVCKQLRAAEATQEPAPTPGLMAAIAYGDVRKAVLLFDTAAQAHAFVKSVRVSAAPGRAAEAA